MIAFEVSKAELVVHRAPEGVCAALPNARAAVRRYLKKQTGFKPGMNPGKFLIICEAQAAMSARSSKPRTNWALPATAPTGYRV